MEHAIVGRASASEAAVMGFPHEVKGSGLFCHVTLNFNWILAPLARGQCSRLDRF